MLGFSGKTARQKCLTTVTHPANHINRLPKLERSSTWQANPEPRIIWKSMRVKTPWIDALKESREARLSENVPMPATVKLDLTPKEIQESSYKAILPLIRDPWLLDTYLNASGPIRLGTLLKDVDALAGIVANRHTGDGVTTVTAAVDRIMIDNPLMEIFDLEISGKITYTSGRSSMVISCQVAKARLAGEIAQPDDVLITCTFTMVSLDPKTKAPVSVPPIILRTEEERNHFKAGEENYQTKRALRERSVLLKAPDDEESFAAHSQWIKHIVTSDSNSTLKPQALTGKKTLRSTIIMQPSYRNRHNFMIFGGFLLKETFELAFCCAASFAQSRPNFLSLDPSTFDNPVPVGSLLYLWATVSYTESIELEGDECKYTKVHVHVNSEVRDVDTKMKKPTGIFNYTFLVEKDIQVVPETYSDFMLWTEARRRALRVAADPTQKVSTLRALQNSAKGKSRVL
ncbi:hypothetical protein N7541_009231 [Penicillium brevicompactum]|uniref:HotDog ACOT-type domain-containing protein n=1 Tax=Penicillium brevicompactum TaxID=5074 RepID=A0A9W9QL95_PENBR|nr:hypothetical protein N7541_009231 [Penicillium brevicompactum]